jgi:alpha-L-fucosidase 2
MKYFLISGLLLVMAIGSASAQPQPRHNLTVKKLTTRSEESFPLGNGLIGAMIWQKGNMLRMSLDRADLWDLRPTRDIDKLTFNMVADHVNRNDYAVIQQLGDVPYVRDPAPSKIRGAALMFDISELGEPDYSTLDISTGICLTHWKSGATFESFVHATKPVGWFRFSRIPENLKPVLEAPVYQGETSTGGTGAGAIQGLATLGYKQGMVLTEGNKIIYDQEAWGGMTYQVAVRWIRKSGGMEGVWSISSKFPDEQIEGKKAGEVVDQALAEGLESHKNTHLAWWKSYWQKSSVMIPDEPVMEQLWYLEQYKFGSGSRQGAPPISLVAVWADDNGSLPPWKGDYHNDINTQYSYWSAYSGNHLDEEISFIDWMWNLRPRFRQYTREFFGVGGLNAPGVCTLDGSPMGGWIQYAMGPTVSCWLAHHFYLHWRYSMDRDFLKSRAYPWFKEVITYLDNITIKEKGIRKLPLSSSPEYNDNRIDAWFRETSNFDLALIRWTYSKGAELAGELGFSEEQKNWKQIENEWPGFSLDESGGLSIAPNLPLERQHRHLSHMLAIQPLGYIDMSNGEIDQDIIRATLAHLEKMGPPEWPGWAANFYARAQDGEKAADCLRKHLEMNCRNQADPDKNLFIQKYNYFFASALQDMLIQSHTGCIRVFPALPGSWRNCSFKGLRTEGAFLVSAEQKEGKTFRVEIFSEKGGSLRIKNPFGPSYRHKDAVMAADSDILEFKCKPNETILLDPN